MSKKQIKSKPKEILPGLYNAKVTSITDHGNNVISVQLKLLRGEVALKKPVPAPKKLSESDPMKGTERFYILNSRLCIYTGIGADNRHHASNKATKLFGSHWTSLTQNTKLVNDYKDCTVAEFSELLRTL